jgi:hypothetical protein
VDCRTPGTQKSTDPPHGAYLTGLRGPYVVHRPPHVILLTLCSDRLAGRGDHLLLRYVHLARHGGPRCHRADRLPLRADQPARRGGPCRHCADQLPPCAAHPAHRGGPHRHCVDRLLLVLLIVLVQIVIVLFILILVRFNLLLMLVILLVQFVNVIRVLDSNPFTIQCRWRPQCSFGTKGTPQGPRGLECCDPFARNLEFPRFSLDAPGSAHHSGRAVHLAPCSGPRRYHADHLSPHASPRHHHVVFLAPHAAHPDGPRRHRAVLLTPCVAHPAGPCRHRADRHARELRVLVGCLVTFHCLLMPQCNFGTEYTLQGSRVLNCNTVYASSPKYPQASPSSSRGVNLFPRDDHCARQADQLAPRGIHLGSPHRV